MNPVERVERLPAQGPWPTRDPFLFIVHHNDHYPRETGRRVQTPPLRAERSGVTLAIKTIGACITGSGLRVFRGTLTVVLKPSRW